MRISVRVFIFILECSEFLIESEAQSAEYFSDFAPKARADEFKSRAGILYLFSRSAERRELLIEAEAPNAESLKARSTESLSDVAPNARRMRAECESRSGFIYVYIYIYIYSDVCTDWIID